MYNSKPLEIATKAYYWKPMAALFRSIELGLYSDSGLVLHDPILDLGCGDGRIPQMLRELDIIEKLLCGIEISHVELKKAQETDMHLNLLQADANYLPFKANSFSSIICNGVLCSIPEGVDQPLKEANRVLKEKGIFVATIPTDKFIEVLILPKILTLFSHALSKLYVQKLNDRLPHFYAYSPQQWRKKFEDNGLRIIKIEKFFSPRAGFVWNIFSMRIFRIFGLLKFIKNKRFVHCFSWLLNMSFKRVCEKEKVQQDLNFGYAFIIAQKK